MSNRKAVLRVLALAAAPLLGLIILAWGLIQTQQDERDLAAGITAGTVLFEKLSDAVTELQRERGKSVIFLEGAFSEAKLLEQHQETNQALRQLERQLTLGTYHEAVVLKILDRIKSFEIPRIEILGRQWKSADAFSFYSLPIKEFLLAEKEVLFQSRQGKLDQALGTLLWLEAIREQAGRLRARVARILAEDKHLSQDDLGLILGSSFVPSPVFDVVQLVLQGDVLAELEKQREKPEWKLARQTMETIVREAGIGSFSMEPNLFFEAMTVVVDNIDEVLKAKLRHMRELETDNFLDAGARIRKVKHLVLMILMYLLIMGLVSWRQLIAAKAAESQIHVLSAQKELILNAAGEGIFGLKEDGTILFANPSALSMLGYTAEELLGRCSHNLTNQHNLTIQHSADGSEISASGCSILKTWKDGEIQRRADTVFLRKDGTPLEVEYVATPLNDESGKRGAVVVFADVSTRRALEKDLRQALENLESVQEQENQIGFQIQEALLFGHPPQDMPDLKVSRLAIPARGVDGDFFNFVSLDDNLLDVLVGDVMGKGIPAALVGAAAKSHFQLALARLTRLGHRNAFPAPGVITAQVCKKMYKPLSDVNRFICLQYGRIDRKNRKLSLVNCGHTPLIHYRGGDETCELVFPSIPPLGVGECDVFPETLVVFDPGDLLVFFSDGITEARNPEREFYGIDRLVELVRTQARLGSEKLVSLINFEILQFIGKMPVNDDLTCIVIESTREKLPKSS